MTQRIFHGNLTPQEIGDMLTASFNRSNFIARQMNSGNKQIVQIISHPQSSAGGATSLTLILEKVEDGVAIQVRKQAMLGVAASLARRCFRSGEIPLI